MTTAAAGRAAAVLAAAALAAAALAGCGDNQHPVDDPLAAVSGSRLVLQKYRYDDGTEQAVSNEFYDIQVHTRCSPQPWADGAVRCVPLADDAVYADAGCTLPVGIERTIAPPSFFTIHAELAAGRVVTHVYRAASPAPAIAQSWSVTADGCVGPTPVMSTPGTFVALGDEIPAGDLIAFRSAEIAAGRLGLELRETDDGLRVLAGLRDRDLDAACTPTVEADGSVSCEPDDAPVASLFADPDCTVGVISASAPPAIAKLIEPSGCASYRAVAGEVTAPVYQRDGASCAPVSAPGDARLFTLGAPLALPPLGRSLEVVPGHRVQRVVLDLAVPSELPGAGATGAPSRPGASLQFYDDRVFDPVIHADCRPRTLRTLIRCIPIDAVAATTLFSDGCTAPAAVAEVPQSCEPLVYATTNRPFQIRPIGAPVSTAVFSLDGDGVCQSHAAAPGSELRALGPPLDLTIFIGAVYFGERSL